MKILITSFQPFRGRERNASQTIGNALAELPTNHTLLHLNLPVLWGSIETLALPKIETFQPDLILGLGEGYPDSLKLETRAQNQRHSLDESESPPANPFIDPTGPETIRARWPLPTPMPPHSQVSNDAGRYLCNNALYRYALSPSTFAGFIHLPPQDSTPSDDYLLHWLPLVQTLLTFATTPNP